MTPDDFTNQELMLDVGDGHTLYIQDWGKADAGVPIIFLHGGPGNGVSDSNKSGFDSSTQRVIFFDQRGCGKSTPYGSLKHNTTTELIEDIKKIADKLKIEKFILTGSSWGSCLALAYGLEHPEHVQAMVLRGIYTGSRAEIDYVAQGHFATHFPDVWDGYLDATPAAHHDNPDAYHTARILGDDEAAAIDSAYAYANLEGALLSLDDRYRPAAKADFDPTVAKLEAHYFATTCFLPDRFIMDNAHKLSMPIWLVQGRYDMVCPPVTAYELHEKLPNSELIWTIGGHRNEHEGWNAVRLALQQASKV
jgi:proline iminopeptidase